MGFGFAQGLGSFLGDFNDESSKIRAANERKNSDDAAIEQRALEHLATADDPQIRAAAVTAMLTPKKPGSGGVLSKWYGTQRDHPVFDQVHQLINGGVEPYMSVEDKQAATSAGNVSGRLAGANEGYKNVTGEDLPNEDIRRGALGALGAPPSRRQPLQFGNMTMEDGSQVAGYTDPETGEFNDTDGNVLTGVVNFTKSSAAGHAANPNSGATWVTKPDSSSPTGFVKFHVNAQGKQMGASVPTVGPNAPPNQVFQTPGGFSAVQPSRAGGPPPKVVPVQGGDMQTHTENPSVDFNALRQIGQDVEKRARASVAHFGGLPPDEKELAVALDREAKVAGFTNWKMLQDNIAAGQRAISGAVQTAAPPEPIDASGGTAPGAPPAPIRPGSTKPAETKPGLRGKTPPRKPIAGGALDINKILAELDKIQ